ncbi:LOW QUALITY PROTEIN: putative taste receptor type 2 member 33 [Hipposideros larvatus]
MMTFLPNIFIILVMIEFVLGNFANVFIALVNCIDWVKRQKISTAHGILTALAASRIGLLWTLIINWYATVFNPALYSLEVSIVFMVWTISNHCSIWLATSLSVLYLLKIASFSSLLFLHLKWKIKRVVLITLLGTLVFLVSHLAVVNIDETMQWNEYEGNITWKTKFRDIVHLSNMTVLTLANVIFFTMSLCVVLLIFSLLKHLKKMQLVAKDPDPSTKVHIRAMQTVISFLLLFAIYILALIISVWSSKSQQNKPCLMLWQVLIILYPSGHSFILIWGNKKLRQAFLSLLWQLKFWLKERK